MTPPHSSERCAWHEYRCDRMPDPTSTKKLCQRHKFEAYQRWMMDHFGVSSAEATHIILDGEP